MAELFGSPLGKMLFYSLTCVFRLFDEPRLLHEAIVSMAAIRSAEAVVLFFLMILNYRVLIQGFAHVSLRLECNGNLIRTQCGLQARCIVDSSDPGVVE